MKMSNEVTSKPASGAGGMGTQPPMSQQMPPQMQPMGQMNQMNNMNGHNGQYPMNEMPQQQQQQQNDFYGNKHMGMDMKNFNMNQLRQQKSPPPRREPPPQEDFLAGIKPSEMGIPHNSGLGSGPAPNGFDRPNPADALNRSPALVNGQPQQNEFQSFEDTFKQVKKPEPQHNGQDIQNSPQKPEMMQSNPADDYDNTPLPAARNTQKMAEFTENQGVALNFDQDENTQIQNDTVAPPQADEAPLDVKESPDDTPVETQPSVNQSNDPNVFNVDEIQIKPKQQLTFEELLEKELQDGDADNKTSIPDDERVIRKKPKKQFLKRSQKAELPVDTSSKKYKYYADHFDKSKPKASSDDVSGLVRSKPVCDTRQGKNNLNEAEMSNGGDSYRKTNGDIDDGVSSLSKDSQSSRSRRTRKARQSKTDNLTDNAQSLNTAFPKKDSQQEFDEIERNLSQNDEYQVISKKPPIESKKTKKGRRDSMPDSTHTTSKPDFSKTVAKPQTETAAERQRLAKEKQEFRKQREKYESDCLALEKQKRDFNKQKVEFGKIQSREENKINAEKMKVEKERKVFLRQNDKKKDDGTVVKELQAAMADLKSESVKKDKRVEKLENDIKLLKERIKHKDQQLQDMQENIENYSKEVQVVANTQSNYTPSKPISKIPGVSSSREKQSETRLLTEKPHDKVNIENNEADLDQSDEDEEEMNQEIGGVSDLKVSLNKQVDNDEEVPFIDEDNEDFSLVFPDKYHGHEDQTAEVVQESEGTKGKIFRLYSNEKREILFTNGVRKEIFPDGYSVVYFSNEDIKQIFPEGKTVYYFADAGTVQSTMPDGLKVYKFNNEQTEKHYTDGTKEIIFPDGTVKYIFGPDDEESIFPDGTIQRLTPDGLKVVEYPSGQKDIIYPDGSKERQYASGKVKKMASDGSKS